jgi:hypothetical protein
MNYLHILCMTLMVWICVLCVTPMMSYRYFPLSFLFNDQFSIKFGRFFTLFTEKSANRFLIKFVKLLANSTEFQFSNFFLFLSRASCVSTEFFQFSPLFSNFTKFDSEFSLLVEFSNIGPMSTYGLIAYTVATTCGLWSNAVAESQGGPQRTWELNPGPCVDGPYSEIWAYTKNTYNCRTQLGFALEAARRRHHGGRLAKGGIGDLRRLPACCQSAPLARLHAAPLDSPSSNTSCTYSIGRCAISRIDHTMLPVLVTAHHGHNGAIDGKSIPLIFCQEPFSLDKISLLFCLPPCSGMF